jgi:hypothetical protein
VGEREGGGGVIHTIRSFLLCVRQSTLQPLTKDGKDKEEGRQFLSRAHLAHVHSGAQ